MRYIQITITAGADTDDHDPIRAALHDILGDAFNLSAAQRAELRADGITEALTIALPPSALLISLTLDESDPRYRPAGILPSAPLALAGALRATAGAPSAIDGEIIG